MPTWYIESLDQASALLSLAIFSGYEVPLPTTNSPNIPDGTITITNITNMFTFYTTPNVGNDDIIINSTSNWTPVAKTVIADAFSNGDIGDGDGGSVQDGMQILSRAVFGSKAAVDFFSNSAALETAYTNAFQTNINLLNAVNTTAATFQLMNAIIATDPKRYAMNYLAFATNSSVTGTYTVIPAITPDRAQDIEDVSGATVQITNFGGVTPIVVHISVTSVGPFVYAIGDRVTFNAAGLDVEITSLTSIQAAMLNGTIGDAGTPTPVPIFVGDKIKVMYSIGPASGQKKADGNDISVEMGTYTAFIDFEVIA